MCIASYQGLAGAARVPELSASYQGIVFIGRSHRRLVQMTAVADSHLEFGPDTPVVGPQLHHQVALHSLHTSSAVTSPGSSAFTATCNGKRCTDAGCTRNRLSNPVSRPDAAEGGTRVRLA